ncbi:alpha/beta hydrolase [Streptomyces erythrochromogenes]|uniref:alpha/beta hydrolase n=1 Tax=Streptomyces erythrochromogenes TaxID=285574 RepID=UPI00386A5493|nr:alpha/beta hydrolase [Streptomyces erythrochromogenes]
MNVREGWGVEDWGPLVPAVAEIWPRVRELLGDSELPDFEAEALEALRALDSARELRETAASRAAADEAEDTAARAVALLFERHEPLGSLLAKEFDRLADRLEVFGPEDPPPSWISWQRALLVPVLYATNRELVTTGRTAAPGTDDGPLSFGQVRVSIPDDHRMGAAKKPRSWRLRLGLREDPASVSLCDPVSPMSREKFADTARARLSEGGGGKALLFVHGYNVSFPAAATRAAQIAYDLNFTGLPMLYSWPSKGLLRGYAADANAVLRAVPSFQAFVRSVLESTGVRELHVIAHSMGNRLLLDALSDLDTRDLSPGAGQLGQVVFAAPDVDAQVFRQRLPRITRQTSGCTLYASSADQALAAAAGLAAGPRAGQAGPGIVVAPDLDTVDATGLDTGLMSHAYVGDHTSVLADIHGLLCQKLPPSERFGLTSVPHGDGVYWSFRP